MSTNNLNFISVGIPTYNSSKYLKACLNSVVSKKMVNQIIISDDGSSKDEFYEVKKIISYFEKKNNKEIKLLKNLNNLGAFHNKLNLIKKSENDFIYILDSDNIAGKNLDSIISKIFQIPDSSSYIYQPNTLFQFHKLPKLQKFISNFHTKYKVQFLKEDGSLYFNDIKNSLIINSGSYDISQFVDNDANVVSNLDSDFLVDKWIFWVLNCGNFIVNKNQIIETFENNLSFNRELLSIDAVVFTYCWLSSGKAIKIFDSFYHYHRKRNDSVSFLEKENSIYATEYFMRAILNS